jgi:hypothetical protein
MRTRARGRHLRRHFGRVRSQAEIEAMLTEEINAQIVERIEGRYQGTLSSGDLFDIHLDEVTIENDITFTDLTID